MRYTEVVDVYCLFILSRVFRAGAAALLNELRSVVLVVYFGLEGTSLCRCLGAVIVSVGI